jgi:hypothetical protein
MLAATRLQPDPRRVMGNVPSAASPDTGNSMPLIGQPSLQKIKFMLAKLQLFGTLFSLRGALLEKR